MKTFVTAVVAAAVLAAAAAQAQAASAPEQRIAALERQVASLTRALAAGPQQTPTDRRVSALTRRATALERRVTTLERQLRTANTNLERASGLAAAGIVFSGCFAAATADAFSATWNVVDQIAAATQAGKTYFGPQATVNDFQTCSALQITRQQGTVPPTVAVFSALTTLIGSRR
jgi:hypothetical protein